MELEARLLPSEALEAVSSMLRGYAHKGQADEEYIKNFAALLMRYPRTVAIACAHPVNGVVRTTPFLPTPADIIGWCEKASQPLQNALDHERRIQSQLEQRDEWEKQAKPNPRRRDGITWAEFEKLVAEGKTKPRPVGAFERGGYLGPTE